MKHVLKILIPACLGFSLPAQAQDCSLKLEQAQQLFEQGRVEQVPELLDSCLRQGFTREEKITAYKLIIRSSLFDGKVEEADEHMQHFLKQYPEYELTEADAADFAYLLKQYEVIPVYSIGLEGGMQRTYLRGSEGYLTSGYGDGGEYSGYITIRAGVSALIYLNTRFDLGIDLSLSSINYTYAEEYQTFGEVHYEEQMTRVELPVDLVYKGPSLGGVTPYARAGLGISYLFSSSATVSLSPTDVGQETERTGPAVSRISDRNIIDLFASVGAGIRYKLPKSFLFLQLGYRIGWIDQVQQDHSTTTDLEWYYFYTDDQFKLSNATLSIGFQYSFYKPFKITSKLP